MKLAIDTRELTEEKGKYIAMVDWTKYDGGQVGTPGAVKYGDTFDEAYNALRKLLEIKGHKVFK